MPTVSIRLLCLLLCLLLALPAWSSGERLAGTVSWVYDGDTIRVTPHGKVRLLGIDTPESESGPRDAFYLRRGLEPARLRKTAAAARDWLLENLKGQPVSLVLDHTHRDQYARLLAYVYLGDGRMANRILLEEGLASVYRRFDFARKEEFLAAEQAARTAGRGLWGE